MTFRDFCQSQSASDTADFPPFPSQPPNRRYSRKSSTLLQRSSETDDCSIWQAQNNATPNAEVVDEPTR